MLALRLLTDPDVVAATGTWAATPIAPDGNGLLELMGPTHESKKRGGGEHDLQDFARPRLLSPEEEALLTSMWNHVTEGLRGGIITRQVDATLTMKNQHGIDVPYMVTMTVVLITNPSTRLIVPELRHGMPGFGGRPQPILGITIHMGGIELVRNYIGFAVRDGMTIDDLRARFREGLRALAAEPSTPRGNRGSR